MKLAKEVLESLMPAVTRARQVIGEDISDLNFRDATIRTFFFVSFLLELVGFATNVHVVSHSLPNIFWRLMASGNYIVLFSWPHIHTEVFGANSIALPCSEEVRYAPFATHLLLITFRMQIKR